MEGWKGKRYVDDGIDDNNDDDDDINDKGENPAAKLKAQINKHSDNRGNLRCRSLLLNASSAIKAVLRPFKGRIRRPDKPTNKFVFSTHLLFFNISQFYIFRASESVCVVRVSGEEDYSPPTIINQDGYA